MIESSTWLNNLHLELSMLDTREYSEPEWGRKDKEVGVGEMPDDLKRVWTLLRSYQKSAAQARVELQFTPVDERPEALARANELASKAEVLSRILWFAVNEHFKIWERPQVGVRKGFEIIYSDEPPPPPQVMGFNIFGGQQ